MWALSNMNAKKSAHKTWKTYRKENGLNLNGIASRSAWLLSRISVKTLLCKRYVNNFLWSLHGQLTFSPSLLTREFRRRISSRRVSFSCRSIGLELLSSVITCVIRSSRQVISLCNFDSFFNASLYSAFNSCLSRTGRCPMAASEPSSKWDPTLISTSAESSLPYTDEGFPKLERQFHYFQPITHTQPDHRVLTFYTLTLIGIHILFFLYISSGTDNENFLTIKIVFCWSRGSFP